MKPKYYNRFQLVPRTTVAYPLQAGLNRWTDWESRNGDTAGRIRKVIGQKLPYFGQRKLRR